MSSQEQNKFDEFIKNHPRESLLMLLMGLVSVWLTPVGIFAIALYVVLSRICHVRWWVILGIGMLIAVPVVAIDAYQSPGQFSLAQYFKDGFDVN